MNKSPRILVLATSMALLVSATACDKLRARDQLNKGRAVVQECAV